jgi:uncharacterized RDD family membrane protein YckC
VPDHFEVGATEPAYGRFSKRLKAVVIDWIVILLLLVTALFVAVSIGSDRTGRILGFTVVAVWLLYEPLLVSLTGSTIGHYRTNLRVVDNHTRGNISFIKAVARVIIKGVLGLYSFVTMATTSRHQAIHDLLTQSTVQIRDRSKARSSDYVTVRTELLNPALPSIGWRILVIVVYVVATYVLAVFVMGGLMLAGVASERCVVREQWCSTFEHAIVLAVSLATFGAIVLFIVQGWRGRLPGCRIRRERGE